MQFSHLAAGALVTYQCCPEHSRNFLMNKTNLMSKANYDLILTLEQWPIDKVIPYPRNARKIPQSAIDKVAASIKEFGWRQPIVVDSDGVIVAGHTRLLAAQKLGLKAVPVHVASDLNRTQIKAYRLADNRVADESCFDDELLALEIADLSSFNFNVELTGFDVDELMAISAIGNATSEGLTQDDAAPPTPSFRVTAPGDVWILGNHRI